MKKLICLVMSLLLVVGIMAGCGSTAVSDETKGSTVEPNQSGEPVANEASEEDVLLVKMWSSDAAKEAVMQELIANYNETIGKEEGICLELTVSTEIANILSLANENNELPLLTDYRGDKLLYEEGSYMLPVAKLPGGEEFLADWEEKVGGWTSWNRLAGSDDIYYLTFSRSGPALYINKEMFVEAGIVDENGEAKAPTTWSEFVECAEKLTTDTTFGLALPLQWSTCAKFDAWYTSFTSTENPIVIDWENLTVEFDLGEGWPAIAEVYQNGWCVPGAESIDNDPARSYFAEGVAGMFLGYTWDIGVFTTQYVADFDWDVSWFTAEDGSEYPTYVGSSLYYRPTRAAEALSEADQVKVMKVIEWLYGDEVGVALTEAGLVYPANGEIVSKCDASKMMPQNLKFAEKLSKGRTCVDISPLWNDPGYENGNGNTMMNDMLLAMCKGEMTFEEVTNMFNELFTASFKEKVENGEIDPEFWG